MSSLPETDSLYSDDPYEEWGWIWVSVSVSRRFQTESNLEQPCRGYIPHDFRCSCWQKKPTALEPRFERREWEELNKETHRAVGGFIINMDERPFDVWQGFNFVLQLLTYIVGFPQWSIGVHDDVQLHKVVLVESCQCPLGPDRPFSILPVHSTGWVYSDRRRQGK